MPSAALQTILAAAGAVAILGIGLKLAGVSGLDAVSALTSRKGYSIERGVAYGPLPEQKLDLYVPDGVAADAPVLVYFHGGNWNSGRRGEYLFVGQAFATAGVIVAIPDYRLYPEVTFPVFVEDGAKALAWLDRTYRQGATPRPIVLIGHSAGAEIAALLTLDRRYLAAEGVPDGVVAGMVGLSGPYDFLPLTRELFRAVFPEPVRDASQPINFANGASAPMLLLAGAADRTVDPANSTRLAEKVAGLGGRAEARFYPGVGHLAPMLALAAVLPIAKAPVRADVLDFIAQISR